MAIVGIKPILNVISALLPCLILIAAAIFLSYLDEKFRKNVYTFCRLSTNKSWDSNGNDGSNSSNLEWTGKVTKEVGYCLQEMYIYAVVCSVGILMALIQLIFAIVVLIKWRVVHWLVWCGPHLFFCIVFIVTFGIVMKFKIYERPGGIFYASALCLDWIFCLVEIVMYIIWTRGVKVEVKEEEDVEPPRKLCECHSSIIIVQSREGQPDKVPSEVIMADDMEEYRDWKAKLYNDFKTVHPSVAKFRLKKDESSRKAEDSKPAVIIWP